LVDSVLCGHRDHPWATPAGWTEVTKYLMPISLGWAINVAVVNLNTWNRLDPKVQAFLTDEFKKYEDQFWTIMESTAKDR
jgi:TRAP-type transport system periplasmic protein